MSMPEASIYKDHGAVFRQHEIRPSRQLPVVQAISEPCSEQAFPYQNLRPCILPPDRCHIPAAGFRAVNIRHNAEAERLPSAQGVAGCVGA